MRRILCFGDSNTYGFVPGGGRYPASSRYPDLLGSGLGDGFSVIADGLVGRTTVFHDPARPGRRGLDAIGASVRSAAPDGVVLMLGTNDCKSVFGADAEMVADGMARLAHIVRLELPQTGIVLVSPVLLGEAAVAAGAYDERSLAVSASLAAAFRRIAFDHGFAFWNAASSAAASPVDGEHLTAEGHRALARDLRKVVSVL